MNIRTINLIYFSPTGTTRKVLEGIASGMEGATVGATDLTPPMAAASDWEPVSADLAIIGAPVYGGRIPPVAAQRLRRLEAAATPAVVVAVYGNRAYEDALLELRDLAVAGGFRPIAGGAFIGEHSYETADLPIAHGRPDAVDLGIAAVFGQTILNKLVGMDELEEIGTLEVPGDFPYKELRQGDSMSPITQEEICILCGKCAEVCPTGVVSVDAAVVTDASGCIRCTACVKSCPTGARIWDHPRIAKAAYSLSTEHGQRREPETFV